MRNIDSSRAIFVLLTYLFSYCNTLRVGDRFFLDDSIASELEDWELRWLKDAVRRGKAFVSKGAQKNGVFEDDDWESFARSVQAQNNAHTHSRPSSAIPAAEPSFLGSFGGAGGPVVSIGPPQSGAASSFAGLPGPSNQGSNQFFFGNLDTSGFMQPVIVQPQSTLQQPAVPRPFPSPRPFPRRMTRPPSPPSTTTPPHHGPSSRVEQEPTEAETAEFNAFDNILRHLISRRQQILNEDEGGLQQIQQPPAASVTTAPPPKKRKQPLRPLKGIITEEGESSRVDRRTSQPPALPGHPPNEWVMMDPEEEDPEREDHRVPDQLPMPTVQQEREQLPPVLQDRFDHVEEQSFTIDSLHSMDPEEEQIRLLSSELASLISRMKKRKREPKVKKKPAKARVFVIRNGTAEGLANRQYNLVATITLIRDGGKNILVDTGLASDINGRTDMIRRLESLGVPTPAVHIVVSTHGHPDHAGNSHLFPDAVHYHGWYVHERTVFNLSNLFDSDREQISPSVSLLRTPGHTSEDISVLVRDAIDEWGSSLGNVAVAGDVFVRREDVENDREWVPLSADVKSQALSRRTLLCKSDHIVPGHGPPFRVDSSLRTHFKC